MEHAVIQTGQIHVPHNWEYADATARTAAAHVDPATVGRLALQLDNGSYWRLSAVAPAVWAAVGGATTYTHTQSTPASTWVIPHGLGRIPNVRVFDSAGDEVEGDFTVLGVSSLTMVFSAAFSGVAYCN